MSLKSFHIFFIVTAIGLMTFLAYWSGTRAARGEESYTKPLAACSAAGVLVGTAYLGWFIRKSRAL